MAVFPNESGLKLCCNSLSCSWYDNKKICLSCQNKKCSNKVDRRLETVEKPITSADIKCRCGINQKNEVKKMSVKAQDACVTSRVFLALVVHVKIAIIHLERVS